MGTYLRLIRLVLRVPAPRIARDDAMLIAKQECERQGWTWRAIHVIEDLREWTFVTNSDFVGLHAYITVDSVTGRVIRTRNMGL